MKDLFKNETYILGSGRSLLDLSTREVEKINKADLVISLNKYLIFMEKVEIVPHVHLQFDATDNPSYYVFLKTLQKILSESKLHNILLGLSASLFQMARNYLPEENLFTIYDNIEKWNNIAFEEQTWARSLSEKMFHFRGSMTSAINFANVLRPQNIIKLVGVDMSSNEYFFQEEYDKDRCFHDWTYERMKKSGKHSNILDDAELGGVSQELCIGWVRERVRDGGGDLVTVNPNTHYALKKILEVHPFCVEESAGPTESGGENLWYRERSGSLNVKKRDVKLKSRLSLRYRLVSNFFLVVLIKLHKRRTLASLKKNTHCVS